MRNIILVFALLCLLNPVCAKKTKKDFFKFNQLRFKLATENITSAEDSDRITITLTGSKRGSSADMVISFVGLREQITPGAKFQLTTGSIFETGKVNVSGSVDTIINGKQRTVTADDFTQFTGAIRITKVDGDNFSFVLRSKAKDLLLDIPGLDEGLEARITNKIKIRARVTTNLS